MKVTYEFPPDRAGVLSAGNCFPYRHREQRLPLLALNCPAAFAAVCPELSE
jgi:hypothetical protein